MCIRDRLIVSEKGMGKRTSIEEFTRQNRGGKGVKCYKITEKTGNVVGMKAVNESDEIMMINSEGIIIRMSCEGISELGRITSGVKPVSYTHLDVYKRQGTGSYPPFAKGLQRKILHAVKSPPFNTPYFSIASIPYWEQVGI